MEVNARTMKIGAQTVQPTAWESDDTYEDFPYRAAVQLPDVTTDYVPDVVFVLSDAISGQLAPISESYSGGVYIYAKEEIQSVVNIASITCIK